MPRRSMPSSRPRSVAVVGASRAPRLDRLVDPPQPDRGAVHRRDLPGQPEGDRDPLAQVLPVARRDPRPDRPRGDRGAAGAGAGGRRGGDRAAACAAFVVITAGFGETGDEGRALEAQLRDTVRAAGARMIGPNCMGVINTDAAVSLERHLRADPGARRARSASSASRARSASRSSTSPQQLGIGLTQFVSMGNKADVSGNDLLEYWEDDPATRVICMYLESFGNPRRFTEIAKRVTQQEADPDRQVRAHRRRGARRLEPHRRAGRHRRHRLGLPRPVRRAARRHHRGAVRRRPRPRPLPAARGRRGWRSSPTPAGRRSWRPTPASTSGSRWPSSRAATRADARDLPAAGGLARQSGRHDRLGDRRAVRPDARRGARRPGRRRARW